ncbi:PITH domain-containing protein [Astrocystis sublimbata]|nr:PITH domain-containing protein [Astrocystis sublimbata]
MSHCHNEHAANGGHDHHDHDHSGHDHSDDIEPALHSLMFQHIEFDNIRTLNEAVPGSGKAIVKKDWKQRMQVMPELASDMDEQIIITIPFAGTVKLHSILLRTSPSASAPRTMQVYINRDDLDFPGAEASKPTQTFELSQTTDMQEIPVKRTLFRSTHHISLFFVDNFGTRRHDSDNDSDEEDSDEEEEVTRISYIGFKGEWQALGRAPQQIIYEAAANPNDHALEGSVKDGAFSNTPSQRGR